MLDADADRPFVFFVPCLLSCTSTVVRLRLRLRSRKWPPPSTPLALGPAAGGGEYCARRRPRGQACSACPSDRAWINSEAEEPAAAIPARPALPLLLLLLADTRGDKGSAG